MRKRHRAAKWHIPNAIFGGFPGGKIGGRLLKTAWERSLQYKLDRRLRLLTEPEHKALYSWAILETDELGQVDGRHQIPWPWALHFTATEVVLGERLTVKEAGELEGRLAVKAERSQIQTIRAKLRPGESHGDKDQCRHTTYRMFGTERAIKQFWLEIFPLEAEEENEVVNAWGFVSYQNRDIRTHSDEDTIGFNLQVKPSTFVRYAQRIAEGSANEIIVSVGRVSGFYSEWSPDVVTREVKVLCAGKDQAIELPVGVEFEPPRLGLVGEITLHMHCARAQRGYAPTNDDVDVAPSATVLVSPGVETKVMSDSGVANHLAALRRLALCIIGLMVVIVFILASKS